MIYKSISHVNNADFKWSTVEGTLKLIYILSFVIQPKYYESQYNVNVRKL